MLLNIEKEKPEIVLDIDRIEAAVRATIQQHPDKFSQFIDILARGDGTLTLTTIDGGTLHWPEGHVPEPAQPGPAPTAAARAYSSSTTGRLAPLARPAIGTAARVPVNGQMAPKQAPGGPPAPITKHEFLRRAVVAAQNAALRKHLVAHQKEFAADFQALVQAIKNDDQPAQAKLRETYAAVIAVEQAVKQALTTLQAFEAGLGQGG